MIKKILKDVLGENFTENNEKYAKINFIIVILMFLVSAIMLFFLPEKINILHNGDTYYPIPSILGIWLVPVISLVLNFTFIKQKKLSSLNSIIMGLLLIGSRRKIIYLLKSKCLCAGDIDKHFELTGATISHHLKVLAEGNLITSKKVGLEIYYSLNIEKYNVLSRWFQFLNDIENFKEKGIK